MWSGLTFGIPGGAITAVALAIVLAFLVVRDVRALGSERRASRRRALAAFRIVTAAFAWLVASQPKWTVQRFEDASGRVAVLVDASRSMQLPHNGAGGMASRAERAERLLARWADAPGAPVAAYTFGSALRPASLDELAQGLEPNADESRLGAAIDRLLREDPELGAVVVVSDGADRSSFDTSRLETDGVRVHTVALAEDELRDDSIAEVSADPIGFLRRTARVRVVVRALGGGGGLVPVTLHRGDEVEREVMADVPPGGEAVVELQFTPRRLGRAVYRVSIPRASDDAVPENNERAFLVRVTRDKLRVLLVAGQPSWDQRFLRSFLKRDPATDLISFFILRNTTDMTMAGPDELALIPFPTDELFNEHLGSFDLVILQNFEYGPYQMASYLPRIRDYVIRGGSFAMIGGPLSFHSGGYADTPIAEILPVELPPRQSPPSSVVVEGDFAPRIAPGMEHHPLLGLVPDRSQNLAAWGRLADLSGINVVARVRPSAAVLLEHPSARMASGGAHPVLVLGTAGEGRTLAFTTDTSWRWGITTGGLTGDASAYETFWDRAVRWLTRDPMLEPARVTTDRERYGPGSRARVDAVLRDQRYAPHAHQPSVITLEDSAENELARWEGETDREGEAHTTLTLPDRPGAYRVRASVVGQPTSAEEWLVVEAGGDELADPRADPGLLERVAERTGGRFIDRPEDAPALRDFEASRRRSAGAEEHAPFNGWPAVVALIAVLGAEWMLRRRWGRR
ncbi:MAG: glutamine amidotransferase [Sandaracinaceae bacterium]